MSYSGPITNKVKAKMRLDMNFADSNKGSKNPEWTGFRNQSLFNAKWVRLEDLCVRRVQKWSEKRDRVNIGLTFTRSKNYVYYYYAI